jgi:hypothetical protein
VSEQFSRFFSIRNPILWGIALSIILLGGVGWLGPQIGPDGKTRFVEFLNSPPNAIGDTLAGIFAPLAFIWIVVTVFLQSYELSEQRKELGLTREELQLAREAQQQQLGVMQKQAAIFEDEKRRRDQHDSADYMNQLFKSLYVGISDITAKGFNWKYKVKNPNFGSPTVEVDLRNYSNLRETFEEGALQTIKDFRHIYAQVADNWDGFLDKPDAMLKKDLILLVQTIDILLGLELKLSSGQSERLRRVRLSDLKHILLQFINEASLWPDGVA